MLKDPKRWAAPFQRGPLMYVAISLALLAPCYWQPRVQAGDLSSHIYNAWLAQLIESGRADGLQIVRQTTNVLFDLILSALFRVFGAEGAQRIAVSIAVLTFVWGAFAFINRVADRRSWHLLPCLAMLAYGWVFHMGFFNFYLSMGLSCWAMSLAWGLVPRRVAAAAVLLMVAYVAHALPVVWVLGLLTYAELARRMSPLHRAWLTSGFVFAMGAVHVLLGRSMLTRWSLSQFALLSGVDQVWVFDGKYYFVLVGLLGVWGLLFLALLRSRGARDVVMSIPFHLCLIGASAVVILPNAVLLPGFSAALIFIAERMSLGVAVCVCALLAGVQSSKMQRYALVGIAIVFFAFVYRDERALNAFEDRMQDVVSALPAGERVVSSIQVDAQNLRANAFAYHILDRVCIGRCYSYANYEPSSKAFRIRATAGNPIVTAAYDDSYRLQIGDYVVKKDDLPLYAVDVDHDGRILIKTLHAGARNGVTEWRVL
jgi:hypothetical protein